MPINIRKIATRILPVVAASVAVGLLTGCSSSAAANSAGSATTATTMQLGWIANVENMGPYTALHEGDYKAEGLSNTITPGGPSVTVEPLVASGKTLVGLSSVDSVAKAILAGAPIKVVAASLQVNPTSVMSLASAPINTINDLQGKRLCVQTSGVEMMKTILQANHVANVQFVPAQYDPSPLVTGQCDAFTSFLNNQPVTLAAQGIKTKVFLLSDAGYNVLADAFVVSDQTLADPAKRAAVVKMIRATAKGWRTALDDTDTAAQLMVTDYGKSQNLDLDQQKLGAKTYQQLVETPETKKNGLLTMSPATIAKNVQTLNMLGIKITAKQLFDTSLLAQAEPVK